MQDWAEVKRLCEREAKSEREIAKLLGMSRTTVARLRKLEEPPTYERPRRPSLLDPYREEILALLGEDPTVPATVMWERLRRSGYAGGISILKDHLARVRPALLAARVYQRTSYLPGELIQIDWWHTGLLIPVGKGFSRKAYGLVSTLPFSAAHAVVFTLGKTRADFLPAFLGCLERLGGVPEKVVSDNDSSLLFRRPGLRGELHAEVARLFGHLRLKPIVLMPRRPESKGQVERTISYLETSFLPLRTFTCLADLQEQADHWAEEVAYARYHRRVGARVKAALAREQECLHPLPRVLPDTDRHLEARVGKDCFVRVASADYSVPPGLLSRRVQVRLSLTEVRFFLEGQEIARHERSYVPHDVVLAPEHAEKLKRAQEARFRLRQGDVAVETPDLARYDALLEAAS